MKKILVTAYDIDPYKGSESGTGWNLVLQISRFNKVLAITRKNNRENIDKYIKENCIDISNIIFYYYDLPYYLRFWKKGQRGSSLYFYLWQMFVPIYIKIKNIKFDIIHNLNFHTDVFPTFIWSFKQKSIWGPINHHEKIPSNYLFGNKVKLLESLKWLVKVFLWKFDIFLNISKRKSSVILCGNSSVVKRLNLQHSNFKIFSQVGSKDFMLKEKDRIKDKKEIIILMVGRFVPLKGFNVGVSALCHYLKTNPSLTNNIKVKIVGKGPEKKKLSEIIIKNDLTENFEIINWINKDELNEIYMKSDIFLYPSHEGAGMVVAEALSFGLPIICFNNYGPGELVDDDCSIRIDYSDFNDSVINFSKALGILINDTEYLNRLSIGARQKFKNNYEWDIKGLFLKNLYRGLK